MKNIFLSIIALITYSGNAFSEDSNINTPTAHIFQEFEKAYQTYLEKRISDLSEKNSPTFDSSIYTDILLPKIEKINPNKGSADLSLTEIKSQTLSNCKAQNLSDYQTNKNIDNAITKYWELYAIVCNINIQQQLVKTLESINLGTVIPINSLEFNQVEIKINQQTNRLKRLTINREIVEESIHKLTGLPAQTIQPTTPLSSKIDPVRTIQSHKEYFKKTTYYTDGLARFRKKFKTSDSSHSKAINQIIKILNASDSKEITESDIKHISPKEIQDLFLHINSITDSNLRTHNNSCYLANARLAMFESDFKEWKETNDSLMTFKDSLQSNIISLSPEYLLFMIECQMQRQTAITSLCKLITDIDKMNNSIY